MDHSHLYFGYGSNLSAEDWEAYCQRKGADPRVLRDLQPAWLLDHRLEFDFHSHSRKGGAANIVPGRRGQAVPGALMGLSSDGLALMDRKEGHPHVYRRHPAEVNTLDGVTHAVQTYSVTSGARASTLMAPSSYYESLLRTGLAQRGLPTTPLDASLLGLDSSGHSIEHVFVYGTLLPGECRGNVLEGFNPTASQAAQVTADLRHLGSYPGLVPGPGTVHGRLYSFQDPAAALTTLDSIEGFQPGKPSLYRRVVILAKTSSGPHWASTYVYDGDDGVPIPNGNWLRPD